MGVRETRLQVEYKLMQELRSEVLTWELASWPVPETYLIHYKLTGIIGIRPAGPIFHTQFDVKIEFMLAYPLEPPLVYCISKPYPFHPNISMTDGRICFTDKWNPASAITLPNIVEMAGLLMSYQHFNFDDPYNYEAVEWARKNMQFFPTDERQILLPEDSPIKSGKAKWA